MGRRLIAVGRQLVVSGFAEFAIQQLQLLLLQGQLFVQLVDLLVQHIDGVVLQGQTDFQFGNAGIKVLHGSLSWLCTTKPSFYLYRPLDNKKPPEGGFYQTAWINDDGCANDPRFSTVQLQRPMRLLQWHVLYRCRLLSIVSQQLPMQISHAQHPTLGCEPQRLPIR